MTRTNGYARHAGASNQAATTTYFNAFDADHELAARAIPREPPSSRLVGGRLSALPCVIDRSLRCGHRLRHPEVGEHHRDVRCRCHRAAILPVFEGLGRRLRHHGALA